MSASAENPPPEAKIVNVGILGCGVVGSALVELIHERREAIIAASGVDLRVTAVAVRSASKDRPGVPSELLTNDAKGVVADENVDLVVEVIGGIEPARSLILSALESGKPIVTANKELVANYGAELSTAADAAGVDLLFEAAVAGAIPIVRPLRESLLGEDITRVMGIVNGTTNYILTKMSEEGASYEAALAEAQKLGYAEADPTADVGGFDAGAKAAIMASIAFGAQVVAGDVYHEGISDITKADIDYAKALGFEIKLLAIAEVIDGDQREIGVRVHPAMVPHTHPLASVRDSFNAVFIEGRSAGELMFYGRGAGGRPTASAVLGDLIDAAANVSSGTHRTVPVGKPCRIRSIDDIESAYYLNIEVNDRPGVLAQVASVFGEHGLSILSMNQEGLGAGARIAFITHSAMERDLQAALHDLRQLDVVIGIGSVLRVIEA